MNLISCRAYGTTARFSFKFTVCQIDDIIDYELRTLNDGYKELMVHSFSFTVLSNFRAQVAKF